MISPESPLFPGLGQSQERWGSWNPIHSAGERFGSWRPGAMEGAAESIEVSKTVIQCACRRTTPAPLWYFCLWSANNLRSIQSIYLTLQRYCHSTLSVYRRAWTNQELLWECGSSYFLYCSLMSASPPLERCFFSLPFCGGNVSETRDLCGILAFWRCQ